MTTPFLRPDIKRDEGVRSKAYRDTRGIWTIAVGHNIQADPVMQGRLSKLITDGLTPAEIDALLDHDLAVCEHALDVYLPWWRKLDDLRQDVLANMSFNLGISKLLGFRNTLAFIQAGDWASASRNMLQSAWASQVGRRAVRLSNQMLTGVHQA